MYVVSILFCCYTWTSVCFSANERIVGGHDVNPPGKYGWQGSLEIDGKFHSGAILVIPNAALTTASAISGADWNAITITFGAHDKDSRLEGQPELYHALNMQIYPNYTEELGFPDNLAIIQLNGSVNMDNKFIQTIAIPKADRSPPDWIGQNCYATGWGRTNMSSSVTPNILQEALLPVMLSDDCVDAWTSVGYPESVITDREVCAGDPNKKAGTCTGDDGGPFVCIQEDNSYELVGITSWRSPNCQPELPSVFTMVSYYQEWIIDKLPVP